ncbi:hypothetical protein J5Y09_21425 [Roseomonas sp. PWR1]|uniref:DUF3592 domain-containing protein n=1 Tax=Roseomonas nitratireducens TaxID=2820810 RepID=A0ABS4AYR1_9PROT|nr:DUF3592 domain-containing protein [Neoroseomonas nitratireducens]MBP0466504.1 hypothetical protein [Neoroseomonas nitratireducens]
MSAGLFLFLFSAALALLALGQVLGALRHRRWPLARLTVESVEHRRGKRGVFLHCRAVDESGYDWTHVEHRLTATRETMPSPGDTFEMRFDPQNRERLAPASPTAALIIAAFMLGAAALPWIARAFSGPAAF